MIFISYLCSSLYLTPTISFPPLSLLQRTVQRRLGTTCWLRNLSPFFVTAPNRATRDQKFSDIEPLISVRCRIKPQYIMPYPHISKTTFLGPDDINIKIRERKATSHTSKYLEDRPSDLFERARDQTVPAYNAVQTVHGSIELWPTKGKLTMYLRLVTRLLQSLHVKTFRQPYDANSMYYIFVTIYRFTAQSSPKKTWMHNFLYFSEYSTSTFCNGVENDMLASSVGRLPARVPSAYLTHAHLRATVRYSTKNMLIWKPLPPAGRYLKLRTIVGRYRIGSACELR